MHEALLYKKLEENAVGCGVCNQFCQINPGRRGICGVRENHDGKLYTLVYEKIISAQVDPIEKKPFYNFLPGTLAFSIATAGCNFRCHHCQNADISQLSKCLPENASIPGNKIIPAEIVKQAKAANCQSVAYTYTEPTVFLELALDVMKLAKKAKLANVWVSNGYMSEKTAKLIIPYLDAINIDLKSFSEKFYINIVGGKLRPVLDNIVRFSKAEVHVEVTTLVIPGQNDSAAELKEIAKFLVKKTGKNTPWHISRFFPHYKTLDASPTPPAKILEAVEIGKKAGLRYVYTGNV